MFGAISTIVVLFGVGIGTYYFLKDKEEDEVIEKRKPESDPVMSSINYLAEMKILFNRNESDSVLREEVSDLIDDMLKLMDTPYRKDAMYKRMITVYLPNLITDYVDAKDAKAFSKNIEDLGLKIRTILESVRQDNTEQFKRTSLIISGMLIDTDKVGS